MGGLRAEGGGGQRDKRKNNNRAIKRTGAGKRSEENLGAGGRGVGSRG